MQYAALFEGIPHVGTPPKGEATGITQDSRKVALGCVFVCIKGQSSDGHAFAQTALEQGAGMVVTQRRLGLPNEVQVEDTRRVLSLLCQNYFGRPADKLALVGITGTNGKTTTAFVLKDILEQAGLQVGLIGTIETQIGAMHIPAKFTTPEPWDLNALLARMAAAGCTHVVMEASSQALQQGRLHGLRFALGVFTNLTQDHLDYHHTMEDYFEAKKLLFAQSDRVLTNMDDPYGRRVAAEAAGVPVHGYSCLEAADYRAKDEKFASDGVSFALEGRGIENGLHIHFGMPGAFSAYNALAAGASALLLGVQPGQVQKALAQNKGVPGRSEVLYSGKFTVICDFAHTPDALEKILATLKEFAKKKMVVLYGCPGSRDRAKRPLMSEAVVRYADEVYYTADNPRAEDPLQIETDAVGPLEKAGKPFVVMQNREQAVLAALEGLQAGDMLVLCGKGHEDYQVLDGYTRYLSEKEIVKRWLVQKGLESS